MAGKIAFELVSPDRVLIAEEVEMVTIPGGEGDFGVLVGHQPMITTVRPGVLEVSGEGQTPRRFFVGGGFAEVTNERCAVMIEEAVSVDELKRPEVEQRIKDVEEDLGNAKTDLDRRLLEIRLATLKEMLQVAI
ncbi:MAG: F0F1 ATP synthase subunit epsilon [Alphaproteobacteria bacterium]|nr:F0F1 ATP synthase subunit epsilon [Alphaproteobacteria bacterium]